MKNAEIFHRGRWQHHHTTWAGGPLQVFRDTRWVRLYGGLRLEDSEYDRRIASAMADMLGSHMMNIFQFLENGSGEAGCMLGWRAQGHEHAPDARNCVIHHIEMLEHSWEWRWDYEAAELRLLSRIGLEIVEGRENGL